MYVMLTIFLMSHVCDGMVVLNNYDGTYVLLFGLITTNCLCFLVYTSESGLVNTILLIPRAISPEDIIQNALVTVGPFMIYHVLGVTPGEIAYIWDIDMGSFVLDHPHDSSIARMFYRMYVTFPGNVSTHGVRTTPAISLLSADASFLNLLNLLNELPSDSATPDAFSDTLWTHNLVQDGDNWDAEQSLDDEE